MTGWLDATRRHESTAGNTFADDDPPPIVRGENAWLYAADGRRWLDLVSGSAATVLGHGNAAQRMAIERALAHGVLHTGTRLPSEARAGLYERLVRLSPHGLDAVHLMNSGAEAVETALKAAEYATGRHGFIAFQGGYHGRTLGALSVTASRRLRASFMPPARPVAFLPYPYAARPPLPRASPDTLADDCLAVLRHALECPVSGVDLPAAVIVEAVQGVGGVIAPAPSFLQGLRALCDAHGIVLIADEIWTGFGRTGAWFAYQHAGVTPDLVTVGKALSGSLPLAGVIGRAELLQRWPSGLHTSTFQGNPVACAAASATIDALEDQGLVARAGGALADALAAWCAGLGAIPGIGEARVAGALAGVEIEDGSGRPDPARARAVLAAAAARGVLAYRGGWYGNVLMVVPPLTITLDDLAAGLAMLMLAIGETTS